MNLVFGFLVLMFFCFSGLTTACTPQGDTAAGGATRRSAGNSSEVESESRASAPIDASVVIRRVATKYGNLQSYRSRGVNKHTSNFNGDERVQTEVPFEIEYLRGKSGSIKWQQNNHSKVLRIEGKKSWLEVDGNVEEHYKVPRDGLSVAALADGGWSLFFINVFVFRDELLMGDKFFTGLAEPKIIDERDLDGRTCYVLSGSYSYVEGSQTFWIDKENSLIRRSERVIVIRKTDAGKEYVTTSRTTETYSDIEIQ